VYILLDNMRYTKRNDYIGVKSLDQTTFKYL